MINNLNMAGFSEMGAEIRQDPREGHFRYSSRAVLQSRGRAEIFIMPALLGTLKSARQFVMQAATRADNAAPSRLPDALDFFAAGVTACALTTFVGGASARGVVLASAELEMRIPTGSAESPLGLHFFADGDGVSGDRISQLADDVMSSSPNVVTIREPRRICYVAAGTTHDLPISAGAADPSREGSGPETRVWRCRWLSGSQMEVVSVRGDQLLTSRVDQPRQLGGIDWGPNPQEMLLASLCLAFLSTIDSQRGHVAESVAAEAFGLEDVGGLLRVDPNVEVGMQALRVETSSPAVARLRPDVLETLALHPVVRMLSSKTLVTVNTSQGA